MIYRQVHHKITKIDLISRKNLHSRIFFNSNNRINNKINNKFNQYNSLKKIEENQE